MSTTIKRTKYTVPGLQLALLGFMLLWATQSAVAQKCTSGLKPFWIFFQDKGEFTPSELQNALDHEKQLLPRRTLWRRSKTMGVTTITYTDLPVYGPYVETVRRTGGNIRHYSHWLNAVSCDLTPAQVVQLQQSYFVTGIQPVRRFQRDPFEVAGFRSSSDRQSIWETDLFDYTGSREQLQQLNVPGAHSLGFSGLGVIVCMLDTGYMTTHQVFNGRTIIAEWDFINNDATTMNQSGDPSGQHNHGTATFSALAAFVPGTLIGPAFNAAFLLAKTENTAYELPIEEDHWVAGLEWAENNGADVVSSSLAYRLFDDGSGYSFEDLDGQTAVTTQAASMAAERGVLVVNAMGNEGPAPRTLDAPADAFDIIACGAVDASGTIASFSSRGPTADGRTKPELVARGVETVCARTDSVTTYGTANGTSLSTPLLAACAALVFEAHSDWTPFQVRAALMNSADNLDNPDDTYGWGLPDVIGAIYEFTAGDNPVDADGSDRIDGLDLITFSRAYGSHSGEDEYESDLDVEGDGSIDDVELLLVAIYAGRVLNSNDLFRAQ